MKKKLPAAILMLFLSCLTQANVALAQTWTPGIFKGDVFYYEMYAQYTSSNPDAQIQVPAFEANNTDWVRIEISGVNGSTVHHVYTLHFKNDSEQIIEGQTDLLRNSWGTGNADFRGVPICPANLNAGDAIPSVQLTINETVIKSYPDGTREINHVTWNSSEEYGECYFDRKTGMLVELFREHAFANPTTGEVVKKADIVKMTSSSLWAVPEFPTFLVPSLLIIALTLGAVFYSRKRTRLFDRVRGNSRICRIQ